MANIPYQNEFGFSSSSKGKIPWITLNGVEVADSQFCIHYLSQEFKIDLNRNINKNELAAARAFFKLSEESIFYCVMLSRFKYYPGHAGFPQPIFNLMKPRILEISKIQGYGRHTEEEVIKIAKSDLKSINDYIENKKYLTGETVCNEDSALFGVLSLLVYQDCGKITDYVKNECPNIVRYMNNIKVNYWPDWNDNIRHSVIGFFPFLIKTLYSIFE